MKILHGEIIFDQEKKIIKKYVYNAIAKKKKTE